VTVPVDICNLALDAMGARTTIQGINPPRPADSLAAQVASRNYQIQYEAVARAAHWNCLRLQKQLTLLKAALGTPERAANPNLPDPPYPWRYEYAVPGDSLKIRFLIPSPPTVAGQPPIMTGISAIPCHRGNPTMPFTPAVDTDSQGNQIKVILTDAPRAQAVYTGNIANCDLWDSGFRNGIIAVLAAWFVNPIKSDKALLQERVAVAQGAIVQARVSDGNENIQTTDHIPDYIAIRNLGVGHWWLYGGESNGPFIAGWDSISLPGVTF